MGKYYNLITIDYGEQRMKYILIIMASHFNGLAIETIEFNSLDTCQIAAEVVKELKIGRRITVETVCFSKESA